MKFEDKIYLENYYLNNPVKFYTKPKKLRDSFVAVVELLKIALAKLGILKWSFNERIVERPFVFQNLPGNKNSKILDIGCSDSIMPIEMASLGYRTYGNDLKKYPFKHPNFKFIRGNAMNLDFSEGYFDAITCISVLEHVGLSKDYSGNTKTRKDKLLLEKINKLLKKHGIFILTIPFGTKKIMDNLHTRIYDSGECEWLFTGFKKLKESYFYLEGENWVESSPKALENITKNKDRETVAMFVLEKP